MKKIVPIIGLSAVLCASQLYAVDYYFDASASTESTVNWSQTGGGDDVDGYWRIGSSTGEFVRGVLPSESDKIFLSSAAGLKTITIDEDVTVANLSITGGALNSPILGSSVLPLFKVTDSVAITGNFKFSGATLKLELPQITGSRGEVQLLDLYSIKINGDIASGTGNLRLYADGNIKSRIAAGTDTFENGVANPDVIVTGAVAANVFFSTTSGVSYKDQYISVGGVRNTVYSGYCNNGIRGGYNCKLILTQSGVVSTAGSVSQLNSVSGGNSAAYWTPSMGTLGFVMNGEGTQNFTSQLLTFTGGVTVMNGDLKMNFNQNSVYYTYKEFTTVKTNNVVTFCTDNTGAEATVFSHGNLDMRGGVFSSTSGTASYGAFRFTNVVYSDGKIALRLQSETSFDSIDLRGYWEKTVYTDGSDDSYKFVDGGTVKFRDGTVSGTKVTFEFDTAALDWLLDYGDGSFDVNGGKGAKIVAWDSSNKTALEASDFAANVIEAGDEFKAAFTVGDDGLYVRYVAVPEPSECAVLFGVLACAAALYFKRRKWFLNAGRSAVLRWRPVFFLKKQVV